MSLSAFKVADKEGTYIANDPVTEAEIIEMASFIAIQRVVGLDPITSPDLTRKYLRARMLPLEHEVFAVLFLTTTHRVIKYEEVFRGTIDAASVYPREVVKLALQCNAAAVILAHNHPSGCAEPSQADRRITEKLRDALDLIDVRVLDHLIVGTEGIVSFAECGMM
jgi:DNA repair protein RadC